MFVRIVKMGFTEEGITPFLENFEQVKQDIRNFPGNRFLELYRDRNDPQVFFTYSYWETEADLERYRKSDLFCETWAFTKQFFRQKAEAWSVDKLVSLP
jgi:heme-degrading monooxygenase HmoA